MVGILRNKASMYVTICIVNIVALSMYLFKIRLSLHKFAIFRDFRSSTVRTQMCMYNTL